MARKLRNFSTKVFVNGEDASFSAVYHYRGGTAGITDILVKTKKQNDLSFSFPSKEETVRFVQYLLEEINHDSVQHGMAQSYEPTGFAIKIMSVRGVVKTIYDVDANIDSIDSFNLHTLKKAFPEYDTDDYYFVLYTLKDNGISRKKLGDIIEACCSYQKALLLSGDLRLALPMTQKDVAPLANVDNTRVSKSVKDTRIFTKHRNYSLNSGITSIVFPSLFNEGIKIEGERVSTLGIKEKILALIEVEDRKSPLTDDQIVELLKKLGYKIARRTVAKYREQLNIPESRKRKEGQLGRFD